MSRMTGVKLTQHLYQSYQLHLQDDTQLGREMQLVQRLWMFMNSDYWKKRRDVVFIIIITILILYHDHPLHH